MTPLVGSQVTETIDEPRLVVAEPARQLRRGNTLCLETGEDPREKDEVPEPGLDRRGARAEHRREGVTHRAKAQNVKGPGLLERSQQRAHPLACRVIEIKPAKRRCGCVGGCRLQCLAPVVPSPIRSSTEILPQFGTICGGEARRLEPPMPHSKKPDRLILSEPWGLNRRHDPLTNGSTHHPRNAGRHT